MKSPYRSAARTTESRLKLTETRVLKGFRTIRPKSTARNPIGPQYGDVLEIAISVLLSCSPCYGVKGCERPVSRPAGRPPMRWHTGRGMSMLPTFAAVTEPAGKCACLQLAGRPMPAPRRGGSLLPTAAPAAARHPNLSRPRNWLRGW